MATTKSKSSARKKGKRSKLEGVEMDTPLANMEGKKVAKSIEMPKETSTLLNKIAEKCEKRIWEMTVEAIDDLAVKYDMERTKPVSITPESVDNKCSKLRKMVIGLAEMHFNVFAHGGVNNIVKYLNNEINNGK